MRPDSSKPPKWLTSASRIGSSELLSTNALTDGSKYTESRTTINRMDGSRIDSSRFAGSLIGVSATDQEAREKELQRLDVKYTPRKHYEAVTVHILSARPEHDKIGTLLVATRNGVVQLWRTYRVPKYVAQFMAAHVDGDYVTAMASDPANQYLFTSFDSGYLKTWHIANFGVGEDVHGSSLPLLRLRFPFLLNTFFVGRAQRAVKSQTIPMLVNSYRAHLQKIQHVEYVAKLELIFTSSVDKSIRVWALAGHYVGTLGEHVAFCYQFHS